MNIKPPYQSSQGTSSEAASFSGGSKSAVEHSVSRRIREMQQKSSSGDDSKQVISFNDKNTLLAQIRQNLTASKGIGNSLSAKLLESSANARSTLPSSSNLSHFAKQLATLAQRSTTDLLTDVGVGCSPSDMESNGSSSNSGLSPKRPSSLLDPKARALPSASLPKKVATVTPNLSKARFFSPNRPTAPVEPIQKHSKARQSSATDILSIPSNVCSPPPALSALSALSGFVSPSSTKTVDFSRPPKLSPDLGELVAKNDVQHQSTLTDSNGSTASGLFDNLSLASQLEGFASSSSTTAKPSAESLKDLLKTTNDAAVAVETNGSDFEWNGEQAASGGFNNASWPEYSQWGNSQWNGASTSSQVNWQWSQQQQLLNSQAHPNFAGSNTGETSTASNSSHNQTDSYISHQYSNNFDANNQWLNYNSTTNPTTNATMYPSHSLPPNGHFSSPAFYSTPYFSSNPSTYSSYPQASQPGFTNLNTNNYHNQYSGHGASDFTPSYSQPYPGSFSQ